MFPASILQLDEDKPRKHKKHKGKKRSKKSKKAAKARKKSTAQGVATITSQQMMNMGYRCGKAEAENRMLKMVLMLSIGIERGAFNDSLAETGLKLLSGSDSWWILRRMAVFF